MHMICWEKITKPKNRGGLGVHSAKGRNLTLAAKLCWRMETSENAGWAEVLKKKYRLRTQNRKGSKSCVWSAIKKGQPIFDKGSKWIIGNNSLLSFWHDRWLNEGMICSLVEGPLSRGEEEVKVTDVMINGTWSTNNISFVLPDDVLKAIKATPIRRTA